eukprot:TRINITY_DN19787_c0_g1_i1.p1 TRINITY_DN19787_c0_g1~~TRINITY_DN19787_c0_g1_i1.p1  ORF type:complete len:144 (-),score=39.23 TRINITY_DN19787_c0_g1_i1:188-619(-)
MSVMSCVRWLLMSGVALFALSEEAADEGALARPEDAELEWHLPPESDMDPQELDNIHSEYDENKDGKLDVKELWKAIVEADPDMPQDEIDEMSFFFEKWFKGADKNSDAGLQREELTRFVELVAEHGQSKVRYDEGQDEHDDL